MSNETITRRNVIVGAAAAGALAVSARSTAQKTDLTALTIEEASRQIAARQLTSLDLTRAHLERIERLNPRINAYITVTADAALEQARALDRELAAGRSRGPLHGIPIGLKDNIDTAGILTTAASAVYADRVPTEDAPVVTKLREAGAVFLGKLNMHEFAYGGTSAVTHFGPVHNPWDLDYSPGGSSGGSAAAVAARMCMAALGTDTAASIRYPAACCGVAGLKATHGLASIRGIVPLSESHDHVGPLARSVADCALVMTAIAGYDPLDPVSIEAPHEDFHAAIGRETSALRVGMPRTPFFESLDSEIAAATERALAVLKGMTPLMIEIELPAVDAFPVLSAEIYAYHAALVTDPVRRELYKPVTLARIMRDFTTPVTAYIEARRRMTIARRTIGSVFANVDLLVTPTVMRLPHTIEAAVASPTTQADSSLIRNTLPFNVLGIPTISVPCGFTGRGLPIGLQITGPPLGEGAVLALAHAYEQATEWHRREPRL
jgi:aspartyl-tRNA(Asn)/glutamyl-tRNA(Gln) amidotransferase subunit A